MLGIGVLLFLVSIPEEGNLELSSGGSRIGNLGQIPPSPSFSVYSSKKLSRW